MSNISHIPAFIDDIIIATYYDSNNDFSRVMIDAYGKEVIKRKLFKVLSCHLPTAIITESDDFKAGLYSVAGKELLPAKYEMVWNMGYGYFAAGNMLDLGENDKILCNSQNGKVITNYKYIFPADIEGMIKVLKKVNGNTVFGYINCATMQEITPQYDFAEEFSEGLAKVEKNNKRFFIDKNGKVILTDEKFEFQTHSKFSEGVLAIEDRVTGKRGYIYNPVQKSQYVYNQTNFSDATVNNWFSEGNKYFEKEKYVTAKEYYYKVMMAQPKNVSAIISYGACLANLGYYEEAIESYNMALDIEPNNKTALNNIDISRNNMEIARQNAIAQQNAANNRSSTFWDALSSFGQVLYDVGSAYNAGNGSGYNSGGYSGSSSSSSGSSSNCASYKQRYNDMKYKRDREAGGNARREGSAAGKNAAHSIAPDKADGATAGDYRVINSSRALIREYERQMESIARQAKQAGCSVY